jgi:hypothetical protein
MHLDAVIYESFTLILQGAYNFMERLRRTGKVCLRMLRKGPKLIIGRNAERIVGEIFAVPLRFGAAGILTEQSVCFFVAGGDFDAGG